MGKTMKLEYSSSLTQLVEANPSFDCGKLRIAYTGKNRNNSFITKESFEKAIPSMFGCPVVANYMREENEIGSHDGKIVKSKNGEWNYVNVTEPVGFVPPGANWTWEVIDNGEEIHEYLVSEVVLWKRQEAYQKIKENGITAQSMEISVDEGAMVDGCYSITDFYFTAFCLLGTAEPCFEDAALITYSADELQDQLTTMYEEFKLAFANDERFSTEEGGEENMKLEELLEKYSVTLEDLEFDVAELSDDELEKKFSEFFESETEPEEELISEEYEAEESPEDADSANEDFALSQQIFDELAKQIHDAEMLESEYGEYPRYHMVDYDTEVSEVYFEDHSDWNLYGAQYSMNGDNVVIDFDNIKRKKYSIVDFNDGDVDSPLFNFVQEITDLIKSSCDEKFNILEGKYNALVEECNKAAAEKLFEQFDATLAGDTEYEAIKQNTIPEDLKELENQLYALIGKKQFSLIHTNSPTAAPIVPKDESDAEPYGDLFNWKK